MAVRFYTGYEWRFLVVNLADWQALMCLDTLAYDKAGTLRLRGPSTFSGKVPSDDPRVYLPFDDAYDDPFLAEGVRALIGLRREGGTPNWVCRYAGLILQVQDDADDSPVTTYTAYDPWQLLYKRPIRTGAGDLPDEDGLSYTATAGNTIALELLQRTIDADGDCFIDVDSGTFETTASLDIDFQTASSVGDAWDQLSDTGSLDLVLRPIWDPVGRPGKLVELSIYAEAGDDKPGAIFAWGRPPYSLRQITRLEDGTKRANNVQPYAGDVSHPGTLQTDTASVTKYGEYWDLPVYSGQEVTAAAEALAAERLLLLKNGQTVVTISPFPERAPIPFLDYDRGDRVKTLAPVTLRKPINGFVRVYGIPVTIGDDQIETIDSLLTSPDSVT